MKRSFRQGKGDSVPPHHMTRKIERELKKAARRKRKAEARARNARSASAELQMARGEIEDIY